MFKNHVQIEPGANKRAWHIESAIMKAEAAVMGNK